MALALKLNYVDCWAPITALHIHDDYLFTGSGNKLELWPIGELEKPWKSLASKRLFSPFSIHGIQTRSIDDDLFVIVSGNRYLVVLQVIKDVFIRNSVSLEFVNELIFLERWITTIKLHHDVIFAVLSDNSFVTVDMETWKISEKISSPVQCIIYSARILSIDSSENIFIASGTPFKTTSIWCYKNGSTNIISTLNHHGGAVFAIEYDYSSNTLFTASDDRCINVWSHLNCLIGDASSWASSKFILLHQLYSHTARIFSLTTLDGYLISCGENEEICIWSFYSGALMYKTNNSDGSSLWCLATSPKQGAVYVGSNDTSVKRFSLKGKLAQSERISGNCLSSLPKFITYLNSSSSTDPNLLCVTDNGQCSILHVNNGTIIMDRSIYLSETFESYCVGCLSNQNTFYCANRFGIVKAITLPSMVEKYSFQAHDGKILSCLLINNKTLLTSGLNGSIKLWYNQAMVNDYEMNPCRHRWVNCALFDNYRLIVGDASGNLSVFSNKQITSIQSLRAVHDKHGITDLKFHPEFRKTLFSSGRDGKVIEYLWNGETLTKLRLVPIKNDFDWIERISFDSDHELTLVGFSSDNFVVWRKVDSSRLWTVNCGGGHRIWDFKIVNDSLNFSYYSKSDLHFISRLFTPLDMANPYIKSKFHSSKINCSCLIDYDEPVAIIATGGEDCNIVLSQFNSVTGHLKNTDNCKGHISAVRALAAIKKPDGSVLMVSAGGQSQLIVWSITIRKGQRMVIVQVYNNLVDDKNRGQHLRSALEKNNDPISRYLTINIVESQSSGGYLISVTSSDSFIKMFSLIENSLSPFKEIKVCNYCPLALHRINDTLITGSNDGDLRFWIINNQVKKVNNVETLESQIEQLNISRFKQKNSLSSHEAGINCIDSRLIKDDIWLIVSSGDDAVLTASLIRLVGGYIKLIVQKRVGTIHCSQISVVSIFDDVSLLTCSIDQKIAIWSYSVNSDANDITIHPILSRLISVADISSSTILYVKPDRFVIITGVGIEILKVSE